MIARLWHGTTATSKADAYFDFLKMRAVPDYRSVTGNCGVYILRRTEGDITHFMTLTHWTSMDAIRAFAGAEVQKAKYYPEDTEFLLEFEPCVVHWDLHSDVSDT